MILVMDLVVLTVIAIKFRPRKLVFVDGIGSFVTNSPHMVFPADQQDNQNSGRSEQQIFGSNYIPQVDDIDDSTVIDNANLQEKTLMLKKTEKVVIVSYGTQSSNSSDTIEQNRTSFFLAVQESEDRLSENFQSLEN